MYDLEKIKDDLKNTLSEKRFNHCLLVALEAKKLAHKYNYNEDIAYATGLVHDCAKELSDDEVIFYKEKYNIENNNPKTIHADIGAIIAKEKYNFTDEMCQAIKKHTKGGENMTLLDKIILIADKIGRVNLSEKGLELKKQAYINLDSALLKYLQNLKIKLENENTPIDKVTLQLIENLEKK